jgi:ribonuclease E
MAPREKAERGERGRRPRGERRPPSEVTSEAPIDQQAGPAVVAPEPVVMQEMQEVQVPAFATDIPSLGITVQGVDEETTAAGDEMAADGNGTGPAGTGRRRRRGGRGRNRRERGADGEIATEGSQPSDEFAEQAFVTNEDSPMTSEEASSPSEMPLSMMPAEEIIEPVAVETPEVDLQPVAAEAIVTHETVSTTTDVTRATTSAPIVGETDAGIVMETLPSAPVVEKAEAIKVIEPHESLIDEAMAATPVAATVPTPVAARPLDLQSVLSNAGLQLVNTDAGKLENVRAEIAHAPSPVRPARERKRTAPPPSEPLAQVETRKY